MKQRPLDFMDLDEVIDCVRGELHEATERHGQFASAHEGLAVIEEEFLELREAVFWGKKGNMREEAVQVAAMAVRFLMDVMT